MWYLTWHSEALDQDGGEYTAFFQACKTDISYSHVHVGPCSALIEK
jgi:hypothetical protein